MVTFHFDELPARYTPAQKCITITMTALFALARPTGISNHRDPRRN